jgi:hypothetical protein
MLERKNQFKQSLPTYRYAAHVEKSLALTTYQSAQCSRRAGRGDQIEAGTAGKTCVILVNLEDKWL